MAVGQVTLERFVKCVLWRCSFYVFVLPGYAQHILIISFGRVKFSSRLWHNTRLLTRRSIVRAVASSESSGDNCNSCCMHRLTSLQSCSAQFESNSVEKNALERLVEAFLLGGATPD
jgi:hypothetical protein